MRPFKARGGKLIQYHGWADPMVNPLMALDYYESVRKTMGDKTAAEFYRFYLIPGMFHRGAGPGCGLVNWLTPMVHHWVEKATAPETLIGSHWQQGKVDPAKGNGIGVEFLFQVISERAERAAIILTTNLRSPNGRGGGFAQFWPPQRPFRLNHGQECLCHSNFKACTGSTTVALRAGR